MTTQPSLRTRHPYYMYDMMTAQPKAVARVLSEESDSIAELAERLGTIDRIHIVGIGTSWHAALVGEFYLRQISGREDVRSWNSFEFCAYPPALGPSDAVIVLSHRGTKRYSARALELAKSAGAYTAVFTGIGSAARTDLARHVIHTSIPDRSSAFTISHTAAMTCLAMLAIELGAGASRPGAQQHKSDLQDLPLLMTQALSLEAEVHKLAVETRDAQRFYFTGWGPNASTAYEVALKIKESSYLATEGFQMEQYLHGPFVATHDGCVVTFIAPPGAGYSRAIQLAKAVNETGGMAVGLVELGDADLSKVLSRTIELPTVQEFLTPLLYLVPLQMFTYWLAVESGRNPDTFRLDDPKHQAARENYEL
ncbi:MAG: SIS domain-containing protein, partial [Chloroflexi bacterium]|nr:SIS domain-containing protein [Chloroflexota bacterium]